MRTNPGELSVKGVLDEVMAQGRFALSEYEARGVLAAYGAPTAPQHLAQDAATAVAAAKALGYPVVLKACGAELLHKSDKGLVRLRLNSAEAVAFAAEELLAEVAGHDGVDLLVQRMVTGNREVIVGGMRDPIFGPCVMLGVGGIAVEAVGDVTFRLAPLHKNDALEMLSELQGRSLFDAFRGEDPVDQDSLAEVICAVGRLLVDHPRIGQVDINPLIFEGAAPVAVDALITLAEEAQGPLPTEGVGDVMAEERKARFKALFEPESLAVIGATNSPLKWGFRIIFNTLEGQYGGRIYGVNPKHNEILGVRCFPDVAALPEAVDLALIAVPTSAVLDAIKACIEKEIKAVLIITAGFGEIKDEAAQQAQAEITRLANESGLLIVGPNCAGLASPPQKLYSGMISRFPGPGGMTVVSQSGNVGSTVLTWAGLHQVGLCAFISTGNQAATQTEDYLDYFAQDPQTTSILAYVEGTRQGRRFYEALRQASKAKPVVLIKGGRSSIGMKAAQSHTGALASEMRVFTAACRQAGVSVVKNTYEAMEIAGVFARQPLPRGRRVVIVSEGGGWGVIATDACVEAGLDVIPLPADLVEELDAFLPGWWSRNNPIDMVAGNDRRITTKAAECVIRHPEVDALIILGLGYISSALNRFKSSENAASMGLDQLAAMGSQMEVEDARILASLITKYDKPIFAASDTALTAYGSPPNAAIAELERLGVFVFSSPTHVAHTMAAMVERYEYLHEIPRKHAPRIS